MKRAIQFFSVAVLAVVTAYGATLATVQTQVNNWLAGNWGTVTNAQATYFANHGRYWQGLLTCTGTNYPAWSTAANGNTIQDNLDSKPYYQSESIADLFPGFVGVPIPAAFTCDQYIGPNGPGYVVTVYARHNGTVYTRAQNVGPDDYRTRDWSVYAPHIQP